MTGVNSQHPALRDETSATRFGTQADWAMVTLGPKDGGIPDYTPYSQKISLNIKMPFSPVLAPGWDQWENAKLNTSPCQIRERS